MAATQPILRPLSNKHRSKPKGQFTLERLGSGFAFKGGDYDSFSAQFEKEETEVFSNEYPESTLVLVDQTKVDLSISFVARMRTSILRQIATLSEKKSLTQLAAADQTKTVTVPADVVIMLDHRDVTIDSVKAGSVTYVLGTDYTVDSQSGSVEILQHPAGVALVDGAASVTVTYDAAAIAGRTIYRWATKSDQRFVVRFYGAAKWPGEEETMEIFYNTQLSGDGEFTLGADGDEFATFSFTGRCFQDEKGRGLADSVVRV